MAAPGEAVTDPAVVAWADEAGKAAVGADSGVTGAGEGESTTGRGEAGFPGLIIEENGRDQGAGDDHGGKACEEEPITSAGFRPGFLNFRLLDDWFQAFQILFIAAEDRRFVDSHRSGVFPDEISRVHGRREAIELAALHRCEVDETDPCRLEDIRQGQSAGLPQGLQIRDGLLRR